MTQTAEAIETFTCPECLEAGTTKQFARAQALGAHRQRSHGVRGTTRPVRQDAIEERVQSRPTRRQRRPAIEIRHFDADAVLKAAFGSNNIPARQDAIVRVQSWLAEGAALVEMK